jgi:hypothetical protein
MNSSSTLDRFRARLQSGRLPADDIIDYFQ